MPDVENMSPYRYSLHRSIGDNPRRPLGVTMVNPSVATTEYIDDKTSNDNTIRSLIRIAEWNGFDAIFVTNISPWRATDPTELLEAIRSGKDVFSVKENAEALAQMADLCGTVVCAWGAIAGRCYELDKAAGDTRRFLLDRRPLLHCFGRTKDGWPKHPLFLPRTTRIVPLATRET